MTRLRCLAVEPWFGGSHERFLQQWQERTRHSVEIAGLPARHWKWRMSAGAWELAGEVRRRDLDRPDAILASDYLDLPAFLGFLPAEWRALPTLLYFHENQLGYPLRPGQQPAERDAQYGFTNVLACVRATRVCFNSSYHREAFANDARELLSRLPRPNPARELELAIEGAEIVHPGIDLDEIPLGPGPEAGAPLRVAFNHRWKHDKDPRAFLEAVALARGQGAQLELVLLGERCGELPEGTQALLAELKPAILQHGYAAKRAEYARWLGRCDLVVSTARHEFFGLSTCEALAAGCTPLLPRRLSYPELLGGFAGEGGLYEGEGELVRMLRRAASDPSAFRDAKVRASMRAGVRRFAAGETARQLDRIVEHLVGVGT